MFQVLSAQIIISVIKLQMTSNQQLTVGCPIMILGVGFEKVN